jgi:hypothetical protein
VRKLSSLARTTKQEGSIQITPAPDEPDKPAAKPAFGTPLQPMSAAPTGVTPPAVPPATSPAAPQSAQTGFMGLPNVNWPVKSGTPIGTILGAGNMPGPEITARARTGLGLLAQVPPAGSLSTYTSDVTKKAAQHPEGLPIAAAAGLTPAALSAALASASPAARQVIKILLEAAGIGTGIAGTEHFLK